MVYKDFEYVENWTKHNIFHLFNIKKNEKSSVKLSYCFQKEILFGFVTILTKLTIIEKLYSE